MAETNSTEQATGDASRGVETQEQHVPYSRFKEVNDQLAAFKELGTPEEIAQVIDQFGKMLESQKRQETSNSEVKVEPKPGDIPAETRAKILRQLEQVTGIDISTLKPALEMLKVRQDSSEEARLEKIRNDANDLVGKLALDAGFAEDQLPRIAGLVASRVYGNNTMLSEFLRGNLAVVKQAFTKENEEFLSKNLVKPLKIKKSPALSVLSGNQGLPGTEKSQRTLTNAEIAKLPPHERRQVMGQQAWDYYHLQLAERENTGE